MENMMKTKMETENLPLMKNAKREKLTKISRLIL